MNTMGSGSSPCCNPCHEDRPNLPRQVSDNGKARSLDRRVAGIAAKLATAAA